MRRFISHGLTPCSIYLAVLACQVGEADAVSGARAAEFEERDRGAPTGDAPEGVERIPGAEVTDANRPAAVGLYCGSICPPFLISTGLGCSTGCPGLCPNAVICQNLPPPPPKAAIWGDPDKVVVGPQMLGTSTVCWDTQGLKYPVWIRVRMGDDPGQLFTKESDPGKYCEKAPWIQAGITYTFRIHDDNADDSPVYATGTVMGVAGP